MPPGCSVLDSETALDGVGRRLAERAFSWAIDCSTMVSETLVGADGVGGRRESRQRRMPELVVEHVERQAPLARHLSRGVEHAAEEHGCAAGKSSSAGQSYSCRLLVRSRLWREDR